MGRHEKGESRAVSRVRSFGVRVALAAALVLLPLSARASGVEVIHVKGVINTGSARYIARSIDHAQALQADLLLVVLDTPGGLLNSTRDIVQKISESEVPVAVYVAPGGASATSAGTIITMSAHVAGMAPGTNIGAAHPVGGQGEDIKGDLKNKAENDTVAFIKAQAVLRHRNADWAEQAIRKSVSATADEALKLNVVDFIAPDLASAIMKIDGRKVEVKGGAERVIKVAGLPITERPMTAAEKFLQFIGDPNVSYLLMAAGGLAVYAELSTPGALVPGIVGAICLILAFISFSTLPVNYGAVALLVLGIVMFIAEVFITSYGALTIGGVVALVLGALFLMDSSTGDLRLSLALVIPTVLALAAITAGIAYLLIKSRRTVYPGLDSFNGLEGEITVVAQDGRSGKCQVRGEIWNFEAPDGAGLKAGERIEVTGRRGFKLNVKRKNAEN